MNLLSQHRPVVFARVGRQGFAICIATNVQDGRQILLRTLRRLVGIHFPRRGDLSIESLRKIGPTLPPIITCIIPNSMIRTLSTTWPSSLDPEVA